MRECFKGKIALITGSTSGFGKETAIELAKNGAIVILHYYNDDERAKNVFEEISKIGEVGDLIKADISTWIPLEKELNLKHGEKEAEFSDYLKSLRAQIKKNTESKLRSEN